MLNNITLNGKYVPDNLLSLAFLSESQTLKRNDLY